LNVLIKYEIASITVPSEFEVDRYISRYPESRTPLDCIGDDMLVEGNDLRLVLGGRPVLNGVNLGMNPGEIYGLLGPNGAGKSVTMSVLTGLRKAASGKVSVLGLDPARQAAQLRRAIGVLPEQSGLYDWMDAQTYLQWFSELYGTSLTLDEAREKLSLVGLRAVDRQAIGTYSRGMRQRLGLARALVNHPQLLILDEPTNGLDPRGRVEIHNVLLELAHSYGVGVLMCTHLLDDVDRLCTRIGIIHQGKTVLQGSLAELLSTRATASHYRLRLDATRSAPELPTDVKVIAAEGQWTVVEVPAGQSASELWARMFARGWSILEIHSEGRTLEELYLSATQEQVAA
jgi:ABC-2 type transport system ATP-binding protein